MLPTPHLTPSLPLASLSAPDDIAIVGTGAVGLTAAIALAQAGFRTVLIGRPAPVRPGRTVALLEGSVRCLAELGIWPDLAPVAGPLASMRIVDATGSLFRGPPVQFDAAELGRDAFGHNVANEDLDRVLSTHAARTLGLTASHGWATAFQAGRDAIAIDVDGRPAVQARLLVAADGRESLARKTAGIGVRVREWPQVALTGIFTHMLPHYAVSTEFHTRQGPFTLVPLPDAPDGLHRSSLVWVMSAPEAKRRQALAPALFAADATQQAARLLGAMTLASDVGAFPIRTSTCTRITGPRLVLTGEAAHALPPIGAQGLNLSFRDIAALVAVLIDARSRHEDLGSPAVLERYAQARRGDIALRSLAVDTLNASLLSRSFLADLVRGGGLAALRSAGPLRRKVMREGLVPGGLPSPVGREPVMLDDPDQHRRSTALS